MLFKVLPPRTIHRVVHRELRGNNNEKNWSARCDISPLSSAGGGGGGRVDKTSLIVYTHSLRYGLFRWSYCTKITPSHGRTPPPLLLGLTHTNESTRSLFNTWSSSYVHPPFDFSQSSFNLLPASRASSCLHRERLCRGIPFAGLRELPGRSVGPRVTFSACEIAGAMLACLRWTFSAYR